MNPTNHFLQYAIHRGEVEGEIVLLGEENEKWVHYAGGISKASEETTESLYAADRQRALSVTWGYPKDVGVLEVIDVKRSIALQELSGVFEAQGGRAAVICAVGAPRPHSFEGAAQFRSRDFEKLYETIDILL